MKEKGSIELLYGGMFCGKTTALQTRVRRHASAGRKIIIFKPDCDTRGCRGILSSHDGVEYPRSDSPKLENISLQTTNDPNFMMIPENVQVVCFEEAQFFTDVEKMVELCMTLRMNGKTVIVSMLDRTYQHKLWPMFIPLIEIADKHKQCRGICHSCGDDSSYSKRMSDNTELVVIGGSDKYETRCFACLEK